MYTTFIHNKGKRYKIVRHKYMTIYMPKSYHVKNNAKFRLSPAKDVNQITQSIRICESS